MVLYLFRIRFCLFNNFRVRAPNSFNANRNVYDVIIVHFWHNHFLLCHQSDLNVECSLCLNDSIFTFYGNDVKFYKKIPIFGVPHAFGFICLLHFIWAIGWQINHFQSVCQWQIEEMQMLNKISHSNCSNFVFLSSLFSLSQKKEASIHTSFAHF